MDLYKIVERDPNGKVIQVFEIYRSEISSLLDIVLDTEPTHSFTITKLNG